MKFRLKATVSLRRALPALTPEQRDQAARAMGVEAVRLIRLRTRNGLDVDHQPFKPYSKEYGRRRRLSGRESDRALLTLSGQLLAGLHVTHAGTGAYEIGWGPKSDTVVRLRSGRGRTKGKRSKNARWTASKLNRTIPAVQKAAYVEAQGRRFFGIEHPSDLAAMEAAGRRVLDRVLGGKR